MYKTIVIKLFSRSYVIDRKSENEYKKFIVTEIPKNLQSNYIFTVNNAIAFNENNETQNVAVDVELVTLLKRKIKAFKKLRRKRYTRNIGYKQYYGYFKINKIHS